MKRIALLAIALAVEASAQSAPPRRAHHTLFYDDVGGRVLLTGGSTPVNGGRSFEFFNDLWSFDGTAWKALPSSGDRISGTRVDVDAQGRIFSYGGFTGSPVSDLRILENDRWRTIGTHPSLTAAEPGFVFDASRNVFVAFGGSTGPGSSSGEVWEFDGTSWAKRGVTGPAPRAAHAMVYDARRKRIVVFGGMGSAPRGQPPASLGDTWEFDGRGWKEMPGPGPAARVSPGVAYDSKRGLTILFGGSNQSGFLGDTWSWDGTVWKKLADTGPAPRAMGYLAYDKKRDRVVLFGGRKGYPDGDLNDTWEWDGARWARFEP